MSQVITVLQATVAPDRTDELRGAFVAMISGERPPAVVETHLLRDDDEATWRILTVWHSAEALDAYRRSVEVPGGLSLFRSVGAEDLSISLSEVVEGRRER